MSSFRVTIYLLATTAMFFFAGCSGDGGNQTSSVVGTVTDEAGSLIQGGRVIAMERKSNSKYSTQTRDDGRYSLPLPEGVYDMGFDDGLANGSYFTGPVVSDGASEIVKDAEIPIGDAGDETVYGTIDHDSLSDLSGWTVEFVSNVVEAGQENVLATATLDSQGAFTASVSGELVMDANVYDQDRNLVEFVDFAKLPGPCRLEFTVGTPVPNLYRHDEEAGDHIHERSTRSRVTRSGPNYPFKFSASNFVRFELKDGKLGVDSGRLWIDTDSWSALSFDEQSNFQSTVSQHLEYQPKFDIELKDDGGWWYKYKVHAYVAGLNACESPVVCWTYFYFEDETKDTYTLKVSIDVHDWHTVSYNSDHPTIIHITDDSPD